ncbi:RNA polymerase subunit sigma-70 [Gordonia sp. (in: high G+C Gram-positive bacteria)]|uniref:RNA polymerase subunit sigma-70 n=1 Tax=Gordonia sp. (in: high G+C Gram-positive bacteria) TaxID=84139 RepID=UPI00168F410F|nr:RNA polymerase subunit sigma-70 [Gordonia sp. (in: high G+C Gram-positive bacteria)]NLG47577.1 RNA polymerase subunit sigma-70 [Gordonia sp. (in: high G+C Gram-positive bacteria)]
MTDDRAFDEATSALRAELLVHCYHMLGSATDAEDVLQEVYLRAWRAFHRFERRSSVRTWMYRIATNTCLTALEGRGRRPLPTGLGTESSDPRGPVVANDEILWLQPLPDGALGDPAAAVTARESVGLAMVAAMQDLPARQRAALIMRDVLAFSAAETAEALDMTVAAANSALARARSTVGEGTRRDGRRAAELSEHEKQVWDEFCSAFERHDIPGVVGVLADDAIWEMPPFPGWYIGAEEIGVLSLTQCPAKVAGDLKMVKTTCNGQPAAGMYLRDGDVWRRFQLDVLTISDGRIVHVGAFFEPELFTMARLPETLAD